MIDESKIKTVGYQYIIKFIEKEDISKDGIITNLRENHQISKGVIFRIGSLAKEQTPEVEEGDTIYFYEKDLNNIIIEGETYSVIASSAIKMLIKK